MRVHCNDCDGHACALLHDSMHAQRISGSSKSRHATSVHRHRICGKGDDGRARGLAAWKHLLSVV